VEEKRHDCLKRREERGWRRIEEWKWIYNWPTVI